jgi:hypothetical protein
MLLTHVSVKREEFQQEDRRDRREERALFLPFFLVFFLLVSCKVVFKVSPVYIPQTVILCPA